MVYLQRWHGWCHMKLQPSQRKSCVHHAPCHFMQSHIRKVYACLAVTCHLHFWQNDRDLLRATVVTRGWNGYRNKSQHRKSTLEKKILPLFCVDLFIWVILFVFHFLLSFPQICTIALCSVLLQNYTFTGSVFFPRDFQVWAADLTINM